MWGETINCNVSGKFAEALNALFHHATEGILISDEEGIILMANPTAEKMFGYELGELPGKLIEDLVPKSVAKKHESYRHSYYKNPHPRSMGVGVALHARKKDDTEFPVEISLTFYRNEEGLYVISFIIDITERKKQEDELLKAHYELEKFAKAHEKNLLAIKSLNADLEKKVHERTMILAEALEELEKSKNELQDAYLREKELNELKSRFVTLASHEFKTPLSTILSSASLISNYKSLNDDIKRQRHVDKIKSAVKNLSAILNEFLSLEKLEEGKIEAKPTEFNLPALIRDTSNEMQDLAKPGQQITYEHEGDEWVYLDDQLLKNILINLLSNGLKYSQENRTVWVKSTVRDRKIEISVKDEGIGISDADKRYLFTRFFRGKNAGNIQGTGLGLNILKKYLDLMNGEIKIWSELNKGSEFTITLKVKKPEMNVGPKKDSDNYSQSNWYED
jgi:PAS domain S-box-containing protein